MKMIAKKGELDCEEEEEEEDEDDIDDLYYESDCEDTYEE